jgi:hypothetical protein
VKPIGITNDGRVVVPGAFEMADTHGVPLGAFMAIARERGCVVSIPSYFARAIESGWTQDQVFAHLREALLEQGAMRDFEGLKDNLIRMFMDVADGLPNATAVEIAAAMRRKVEKD